MLDIYKMCVCTMFNVMMRHVVHHPWVHKNLHSSCIFQEASPRSKLRDQSAWCLPLGLGCELNMKPSWLCIIISES